MHESKLVKNVELVFITLIYKSTSFKISLNAFSSSLVKVIPFPIFSCSGDQSLKSYLGDLLFQLIRLISFVQPFGDSEIIPICSVISY